MGKGPFWRESVWSAAEVLCRSCGVPCTLLRIRAHPLTMKAKLILLVSGLVSVLAGVCYIATCYLLLQLGAGILDYLEAIVQIADLS